ncbi:MAG: RnfABCDGE type electron transport complex subunit G [Blautia sp.]|nr:RnfABCDGE type electron transport complex subunit G [Blautia sp.]
MKNTIIKDAMILTLITLVAGGVLGLVYEITKEPIAKQQEMAKQEAYKSVFEDADSFEVCVEEGDGELAAYLAENGFEAQTINEVMEAKDASGETLGYAINLTTSEGYGGDITFSMGVREDGTLNGISILTISETAGLGMNATKDEFKNQFQDKQAESFEVTKTGAAADNQINAISGATITSNAVTKGVNSGLCAFEYVKEGN